VAIEVIRQTDQHRWTTGSEVARSQFEDCLDAMMKLYFGDAVTHCAEAVKADPDFAVAKLFYARLISHRNPKEAKRLFKQVRGTDLRRLTPRERFLIEYHLARHSQDQNLASQILSDYLSVHPDDPFALNERCAELWKEQEMKDAEECYRRVLKIDPNWVEAQNRLGYAAMAQGRFKEAEELFDTYRYVAPDQANPHDSLGELLTLIGRYDEAQRELASALSTRADFCASYEHWTQLDLLRQRFDDAERRLTEMRRQNDCAKAAESLACSVAVWRAAANGDWNQAWSAAEQGCLDRKIGDVFVIGFQAALKLGKSGDAEKVLERVRALEADPKLPLTARDTWAAVRNHLEGLEELQDGRNRDAVLSFEKADQKLRYWSTAGLGTFKLFNRLSLAEALTRAGRGTQAAAIRKEIAAVNPKIGRSGPARTELP